MSPPYAIEGALGCGQQDFLAPDGPSYDRPQPGEIVLPFRRAASELAGRPWNPSQSIGEDELPYGLLIRDLLEREEIRAARELLNLALRERPGDPDLWALQRILAPPRARRSPATDRERSCELRWLREESRHHRGFWVALDGTGLLAKALSLKELLEQIRSQTPDHPPLVHRIP